MIEATSIAFLYLIVSPMPSQKQNLHYDLRLYILADKQRVLGNGGAQILEAIDECGSIGGAAQKLQMSYKFTWDYLIRMNSRLHAPVIVTRRGGTHARHKKGGGGTKLTPVAKTLLKEFRETDRLVRDLLAKRERVTTQSISTAKARSTHLRT